VRHCPPLPTAVRKSPYMEPAGQAESVDSFRVQTRSGAPDDGLGWM
jgi:hypothetical protein